MEWIQENWFFILFAALFIGMHLSGFGCCGHGRHGGHGGREGHDEHMQSKEGPLERKGGGGSCH